MHPHWRPPDPQSMGHPAVKPMKSMKIWWALQDLNLRPSDYEDHDDSTTVSLRRWSGTLSSGSVDPVAVKRLLS